MARTAKRKSGTQPPISAHPAFPAIVALWFAALFGIGSLVLPNILIEKFVVAIGLSSVISAATPPIGFTAKLSIAAVATVLGALAGLYIARQVVTSQAAQGHSGSRRKAKLSEAPPAKRPIVATEELGEEGLGPVADAQIHDDDTAPAQPAIPGRRRALAVTDDSGRSEFLATVPLPGEGIAEETAEPGFTSLEFGPSPADQPAEIDEVYDQSAAAAQASEHAEAIESLHNAAADTSEDAPTDEDAAEQPRVFGAVVGDRPFDVPAQGAVGEIADDAAMAAPVTVPETERLDERGPLQLGMPDEDPVMTDSSAGENMAYNPFANKAQDEEPSAEPKQIFGQAPAPQAVQMNNAAAPFVPVEPSHSGAPGGSTVAPLAELPMSELIARFARSMQAAGSSVEEADTSQALETAPPFSAAPEAAPASFTFQRGEAIVESEAELAETHEAGQVHEDAPFVMPALGAAAPQSRTFEAAAESGQPTVDVEPAQPAPFAAPASAESDNADGNMPLALQPLDLGAFDEDEEDSDDPFVGDLSFGLNQQGPSGNPFAPPAEPEQVAARQEFGAGLPQQPETNETGDDSDTGNNEGYSSLLSMKSPLGANRDFVRIEDEEDSADDASGPQPTVVFPGQGSNQQQEAGHGAPRPFDAPPNADGTRSARLTRAVPTTPPVKAADPAETEQALREALDKLQRMSGAA